MFLDVIILAAPNEVRRTAKLINILQPPGSPVCGSDSGMLFVVVVVIDVVGTLVVVNSVTVVVIVNVSVLAVVIEVATISVADETVVVEFSVVDALVVIVVVVVVVVVVLLSEIAVDTGLNSSFISLKYRI